MYFNGAKVKSITDAGTGEHVLDSSQDYDADEGIQDIQEVENMEDLRSMLAVKGIKEVKNIQEIENIEEIDNKVAEKFINNENLQNEIDEGETTAEDPMDEEEILQEQADAEGEVVDLLDSEINKEKQKVQVLEQVKENHLHIYEDLIDKIEAALNEKVEDVQVEIVT